MTIDMNKLNELQAPINALKKQMEPLIEARDDYIWELYQSGNTIEDIADAFGFLPRTIESKLKARQKALIGEMRLIY